MVWDEDESLKLSYDELNFIVLIIPSLQQHI